MLKNSAAIFPATVCCPNKKGAGEESLGHTQLSQRRNTGPTAVRDECDVRVEKHAVLLGMQDWTQAVRPIMNKKIRNPAIPVLRVQGAPPIGATAGYLSQRWDSNPRVSVLQTDPLSHLGTPTKKAPDFSARGCVIIRRISISQHLVRAKMCLLSIRFMLITGFNGDVASDVHFFC